MMYSMSNMSMMSSVSSVSSDEATKMSYIYGIYSDNELLYIGSTTALELRWKQHRRDLAQGVHSNKGLQKVYDERDRIDGEFNFQLLNSFEHGTVDIQVVEYLYTSYLRPKCNIRFSMMVGGRMGWLKLANSDTARVMLKGVM